MALRPLKWYKNCVQRLSRIDDANKPTLLHELYVSLLGSSHAQIKDIVSTLPLQNIFDCLNTDNSEQIRCALKVLEHMFCGLEPSFILTNYGEQLIVALQLPQNEIKEFVLDELKKMVSHDSASYVYAKPDLLALVVECVNDSIGVADRAIFLLKIIGKNPEGLLTLYSKPILPIIYDILEKDDNTIRLRMYEVLVDICVRSASFLEETESRHLLAGLAKSLLEGDVLTKLCVLEEIKRLGTTEHGYDYLVENKYLTFLFTEAKDYLDPSKTILLMGIFDLFAVVARNKSTEVFSEYPQMVSHVFALIKSNNERLQHVGLKTIGEIGEVKRGKLALAEYGAAFDDVLVTICRMIIHDNFISKGAALHCVCQLMKLDDEKNKSEEIVQLTKKWFAHILPAFRTIVDLCTNSIDQVNIAALSVLDSLAGLSWGEQLISNVAGCAEILTSKENYLSSCNDVRYIKCSILKSLVLSENAENLFPVDILRRFHVFISTTESRITAGSPDVATMVP